MTLLLFKTPHDVLQMCHTTFKAHTRVKEIPHNDNYELSDDIKSFKL